MTHYDAAKLQVIATVRSLSKFPDTLRGAEPLILDLNASDTEIRKAGEAALKIYGHVDVLVNNAGYGVVAPVEELRYTSCYSCGVTALTLYIA